jgi:hypothetical protein
VPLGTFEKAFLEPYPWLAEVNTTLTPLTQGGTLEPATQLFGSVSVVGMGPITKPQYFLGATPTIVENVQSARKMIIDGGDRIEPINVELLKASFTTKTEAQDPWTNTSKTKAEVLASIQKLPPMSLYTGAILQPFTVNEDHMTFLIDKALENPDMSDIDQNDVRKIIQQLRGRLVVPELSLRTTDGHISRVGTSGYSDGVSVVSSTEVVSMALRDAVDITTLWSDDVELYNSAKEDPLVLAMTDPSIGLRINMADGALDSFGQASILWIVILGFQQFLPEANVLQFDRFMVTWNNNGQTYVKDTADVGLLSNGMIPQSDVTSTVIADIEAEVTV